MCAKAGSGQGNWQIKRVKSKTGPYNGTLLSNAIRNPVSVPDQTIVLWIVDDMDTEFPGWMPGILGPQKKFPFIKIESIS